LPHAVAALSVAAADTLEGLGYISHRDRRIGYAISLRIFDADVEIAGGRSLGKSRLTDEKKENNHEAKQTQ
jgi:hypothetical protein